MSFTISIAPGGQQFQADASQTLLEAALAAGLLLPYSCRDGACSVCKGQILSGQVDHGKASPGALPDSERAAGMALYCCARPLSDLTIESRQVRRADDLPIKKLPSRVQSLEKAASDVMILRLKLPATEKFQFHAGQYIDFLLADGQRRSFSLANSPSVEGEIEVHVRLIPGGMFTTHVFEQMKVRDILRFEGPLGSFWLREDSQKPVILLGGGTGFAPLKGIIEDAIAKGSRRPLTLYWGSRNREGLYQHELATRWAAEHAHIRYVPVLSDEAWDGRQGLVHEAVIADHPDLSGHEVYACGAPAMIDAARAAFTAQCGLPAEAFYADAFTFAGQTT